MKDKRIAIARTFGASKPFDSFWQLLSTVAAFAALWLTMQLTIDVGYWLTLGLALPAAGLVVRLFMIQHDCGHGSFFRRRWTNDYVGRIISIVTLTPYDQWRKAHAIHHACSGNLDRRGVGDMDFLTVDEYLSRSKFKRFQYRLYRNPLILFCIGPVYHFVFRQRFPSAESGSSRTRLSIYATNGVLILVVAAGMYMFGPINFLLVQAPITIVASIIGVWLFYVQHQFDGAYWKRTDKWSFSDAALQGSSQYELPRIISWFSADIGLHHIHHLCSKIPNYRLRECLSGHPELQAENKFGFRQSVSAIKLTLWDEQRERLVGFKELQSTACQSYFSKSSA